MSARRDPTLRLTGWGEFINQYSVYTQPVFWQRLRAEVERTADLDGDWRAMLEERIRGLSEFLERREEHGATEYWQVAP